MELKSELHNHGNSCECIAMTSTWVPEDVIYNAKLLETSIYNFMPGPHLAFLDPIFSGLCNVWILQFVVTLITSVNFRTLIIT